MGHPAVSHRNHGSFLGGSLADIALDRFPDEKKLAATEGADVVDAFEKNHILQASANRACVVVDFASQLVRSEVCLLHWTPPLPVIDIRRVFATLVVNNRLRMAIVNYVRRIYATSFSFHS